MNIIRCDWEEAGAFSLLSAKNLQAFADFLKKKIFIG
jgi:hypothetical protein